MPPAPDDKLNKYKMQQQILKNIKNLLTKENITQNMVDKIFKP